MLVHGSSLGCGADGAALAGVAARRAAPAGRSAAAGSSCSSQPSCSSTSSSEHHRRARRWRPPTGGPRRRPRRRRLALAARLEAVAEQPGDGRARVSSSKNTPRISGPQQPRAAAPRNGRSASSPVDLVELVGPQPAHGVVLARHRARPRPGRAHGHAQHQRRSLTRHLPGEPAGHRDLAAELLGDLAHRRPARGSPPARPSRRAAPSDRPAPAGPYAAGGEHPPRRPRDPTTHARSRRRSGRRAPRSGTVTIHLRRTDENVDEIEAAAAQLGRRVGPGRRCCRT